MRYLVYHPHPTPEESEAVGGLMLTVQLNLAATKLRCAREAAALTHCEKALELQPEFREKLVAYAATNLDSVPQDALEVLGLDEEEELLEPMQA